MKKWLMTITLNWVEWLFQNVGQDYLLKQNENLEISQKILKQLRRSVLLEESARLILAKMDGRLESFEKKLKLVSVSEREKRLETYLQELDAILMMDICDKLLLSLKTNQTERELVLALKQKILYFSHLSPVACIGEYYNSLYSTVVESQFCNEMMKGTVKEIISQGYLRPDLSLVRPAHIIVSTNSLS